eukprot:14915935-Alexandrium_andersonii.AAC.1
MRSGQNHRGRSSVGVRAGSGLVAQRHRHVGGSTGRQACGSARISPSPVRAAVECFGTAQLFGLRW